MILDEIAMENFRQYYGKQKITISKHKNKNITVIHGENGEGKTALLNLIKWGLYNKCYLPESDRLLNEKAEAELNEEEYCLVTADIKFEDNGNRYFVHREIKYKKSANLVKEVGKNFTVTLINELGQLKECSNPQNTINQILPEKMESYFFFDGEKIDNLAKSESSKDIKNAIKNIMGIEIIENTINDLDEVYKVLRKDFGKCLHNKEVMKLSNEIENSEAELKNSKLDINQMIKNNKAILAQKDSIDDKLRKLEGAKELQNKRESIEKNKKAIENSIIDLNNKIRKVYSSGGYLAFTESLIGKVEQILEDRRKKGEIPSGIKEQFVNDLLEQKMCICGRRLNPGTDEYCCVEGWKKKSGNDKLENAFIKISADIKVVKQSRDSLKDRLTELQRLKNDYRNRLRQAQEELNEISLELDNRESENIQQLEEMRKRLETENVQIMANIQMLKSNIENKEKFLNDLNNKLKTARADEEKSIIAQKRLNDAEGARDSLVKILEITIERVREKLQEKINYIYNNFSKKGYNAIINENFELQIIKEDDMYKRQVPMSQGERQITSLCFIGSLVDMARERSNANSDFFKGGIYPIVMDSPFGTLDPEHKKRIAGGMPQLSQQIIIMVTDSQWKGEVEENMYSQVGKSYILENHNHKKDLNEKYEYTIIKEV